MGTPRSTTDCLADLLSREPSDKYRELLVDFVDVQPLTVRRWQRGISKPLGDELIKVRVLLDLFDYHVEEFETIPHVTRQLARLIAFNLFTVEEVKQELRYKNAKDVYQIILRGGGLYPNRTMAMETLVSLGEEDIEKAVVRWRERIAALDREPDSQPPPQPSTPPKVEDKAPAPPTAPTPAPRAQPVPDESWARTILTASGSPGDGQLTTPQPHARDTSELEVAELAALTNSALAFTWALNGVSGGLQPAVKHLQQVLSPEYLYLLTTFIEEVLDES